MRNGQRPQPQPQQSNLNASIEQVRSMMNTLKTSQNREQALYTMIQQNPQFAQITQMMKAGPGNLESLAKQMAQANGIDLNELIKRLSAS